MQNLLITHLGLWIALREEKIEIQFKNEKTVKMTTEAKLLMMVYGIWYVLQNS